MSQQELITIIIRKPGILQKNIYKECGIKGHDYWAVHQLVKKGYINRVSVKGTYELYPTRELLNIENNKVLSNEAKS